MFQDWASTLANPQLAAQQFAQQGIPVPFSPGATAGIGALVGALGLGEKTPLKPGVGAPATPQDAVAAAQGAAAGGPMPPQPGIAGPMAPQVPPAGGGSVLAGMGPDAAAPPQTPGSDPLAFLQALSATAGGGAADQMRGAASQGGAVPMPQMATPNMPSGDVLAQLMLQLQGKGPQQALQQMRMPSGGPGY